MKNFKVKVQNDKVQFFKELLTHLDFVEFEEMEVVAEPRVYPATNFEIRPHKSLMNENLEKRKLNSNLDEDGLESIRKVMSKIEEERNKNRKA
jgi:hypothetical protein